MSKYNLICGDCLQKMQAIPDASIDLILCDLPYGTTACKWDSVIPFDKLWAQYNRIIKEHSAIVLFGSQPFTSVLVTSNLKDFKYEWIWEKAVGSNFALLKYQPMKEHENICVFSNGKHKYFPQPQKRKGSGESRVNYNYHNNNSKFRLFGNFTKTDATAETYDANKRNPSSVQFFNNREKDRGLHPTQKPVALLEYLIKTYTNAGDVVLDNCMGSGSTGVACANTDRDFIGIELDENYFNIAKNRIEAAYNAPRLFTENG